MLQITISTIQLTPEERTYLENLLQKPSTARCMGRRARIVLLAAAGLSDYEIAKKVKMHERTISIWRRRFNNGRLKSLRPIHTQKRCFKS